MFNNSSKLPDLVFSLRFKELLLEIAAFKFVKASRLAVLLRERLQVLLEVFPRISIGVYFLFLYSF